MLTTIQPSARTSVAITIAWDTTRWLTRARCRDPRLWDRLGVVGHTFAATVAAWSDWHDYLGHLLLDLREPSTAQTHLEHALRIGVAALGPDHPDVGAWHNKLGQTVPA
jgi:hypothetical protein